MDTNNGVQLGSVKSVMQKRLTNGEDWAKKVFDRVTDGKHTKVGTVNKREKMTP